MVVTTIRARRLGRANHPENPEIRHLAKFARQMVLAEFGRRGRALDQADFVDKKPWQVRAARLR